MSDKTIYESDYEYLKKDNYDPEDYYSLIDLFMEQSDSILINHLIAPYNQVVQEYIPQFLEKHSRPFYQFSDGHLIYQHYFKFNNIRYKYPQDGKTGKPITPIGAIDNLSAYQAGIYADVEQYLDIVNKNTNDRTTRMVHTLNDKEICFYPIMVKSSLCNLINSPLESQLHCKKDTGGYFIAQKGAEKVTISLLIQAPRKILVYTQKKNNILTYYSTVLSETVSPVNKKSHICSIYFTEQQLQLKSYHFDNNKTNKLINVFTIIKALGITKDIDISNAIVGNYSELEQYVITILHTSMSSMSRDKAIEILIDTIQFKNIVTLKDEQAAYQLKKEQLFRLLSTTFLPHVIPLEFMDQQLETVVNDSNNIEKILIHKAYFLITMCRKLLISFHKDIVEPNVPHTNDKDSILDKYVKVVPYMMFDTFVSSFNSVIDKCRTKFESKNPSNKNPINAIGFIVSSNITNAMKNCLTTSKFMTQNARSTDAKGISQAMSRINPQHAMENMRRVLNNISKENKIVSIRQYNTSQTGSFCPASNPTGESAGLAKQLSLTCDITSDVSYCIPTIISIIRNYKSTKNNTSLFTPLDHITNTSYFNNQTKIFINSSCVGITTEPIELLNILRNRRMNGEIDKYTAIFMKYLEREIHIKTDAGRLIRPLLRVEDNKLIYKGEMSRDVTSWDEFLAKYPRAVEYVSKEEEENLLLAYFPFQVNNMRNNIQNLEPIFEKNKLIYKITTNRYDNNIYHKYTHCEIHPGVMFGVSIAANPFNNYSQSPRILFQYNQGKNSTGVSSLDFKHRCDISYHLTDAMIPVVRSRFSKYNNSESLPGGVNQIVGIISYKGKNQEDSIIVNDSAISKGHMWIHAFKKITETTQSGSSSIQNMEFTKPIAGKVAKSGLINYDKLNHLGYAPVESVIRPYQAMIGRVARRETKNDDEKMYTDKSYVNKNPYNVVVDNVLYKKDHPEYDFIRIRYRISKPLEVGDKLTSRSGQKGTVGGTFHRADMPFTRKGVQPHVIINPNAFPKRMTIGQLIEALLSMYCCIKAEYGDGTPFIGIDIHEINKELNKYGIVDYGFQEMTCGMTGRRMEQLIFCLPSFYQRLKQMSGDKLYGRSRGKYRKINLHPPEGRNKDGGLRIGEMEKDCFTSHGVSKLTKEKLLNNCDIYSLPVCKTCKNIGIKGDNNKNGIDKCLACNIPNVVRVQIPYAAYLMLQEIRSCGIDAKIETGFSRTIK